MSSSINADVQRLYDTESPTEQAYLAAIQANPSQFHTYMWDAFPSLTSKRVQLAIVTALPESIHYFIEHRYSIDHDVKLAAVQSDPFILSSLLYDGGNKNLQLAAVKRNGKAIRSALIYAQMADISIHTDVLREAIKQDPQAKNIIIDFGITPPEL